MMKPERRLLPFRTRRSQSHRKSRESHRLYSDRMNTSSSVRDTSTGNTHSPQPTEREARRDIYRPSKTDLESKTNCFQQQINALDRILVSLLLCRILCRQSDTSGSHRRTTFDRVDARETTSLHV